MVRYCATLTMLGRTLLDPLSVAAPRTVSILDVLPNVVLVDEVQAQALAGGWKSS